MLPTKPTMPLDPIDSVHPIDRLLEEFASNVIPTALIPTVEVLTREFGHPERDLEGVVERLEV